MHAIVRPGDETTYRQSAAFRQFLADCYPGVDLYGRGKAERFRVYPSVNDPRNCAALALDLNCFRLASFWHGQLQDAILQSCSGLLGIQVAGRSTVRRIWFEQNSE